MKIKFMIVTALISIASWAGEVTIDQLAGKFKITSKNPITELGDGISVEYLVTIRPNSTIELVENLVQYTEGQKPQLLSHYNCAGMVSIETTKVESVVECTNGPEFTQRINLSKMTGKVTDKEFSAPVFSSLYGMQIEMNFKRLSE